MRFGVQFVERNAIDRTDFAALWRIEMADALSALCGINFVDLHALINCTVRTLWFTDVTVDALVGDFEAHGDSPTFATSARMVNGCTNSLTSPPRIAISRTMVAEINMYLSEGVRNMVSTPGLSRRFMPAI